MKERRRGVSPIPAVPDQYLNEDQMHGLTILKEYGWGLVCVRQQSEPHPITILKNRLNKSYGVLSKVGILVLSNDFKIRDTHKLVQYS